MQMRFWERVTGLTEIYDSKLSRTVNLIHPLALNSRQRCSDDR